MKKVGKTITALLLVGILAAGVCCMGFAARGDDGKWFGNSNISTWHWADKAPEEEEKPKEENPPEQGDGNAELGEPEEHGIQLLSEKLSRAVYTANAVPQSADSAYILNATAEPSIATNRDFNWSIDFNLDFPSWAPDWVQDKTISDYVTVTPLEGAQVGARVVCLQPFGSQMIIKCTSKCNPEIYATCTVDYYQRVKSITPRFLIRDTLPLKQNVTSLSLLLDTFKIIPLIKYYDYTIQSECEEQYTVSLDEEFVIALSEQILPELQREYYGEEDCFNWTEFKTQKSLNKGSFASTSNRYTVYTVLAELVTSKSPTDEGFGDSDVWRTDFSDAVLDYCAKNPSNHVFKFTYKVVNKTLNTDFVETTYINLT